MIGAISIRLNEKCYAYIYLFGTYDRINWKSRHECELGKEYAQYEYFDDSAKVTGIVISRSVNGQHILRLKETKRYTIKISDNSTVESPIIPVFQNEGKFLKCDRDNETIVFQFINYLGRSRVSFSGCDSEIVFEVIPDKFDYEEDYIKLTEELAERCAELLLHYSGSTSNVYSLSENMTDSLLEQFIFLRQFCYSRNIYALFEAIKRNPDRLLEFEEITKPFGVDRPSKRFYRNPIQYSRNWTRIARSGNTECIYAPQMIAVSRKFDKLDTVANRFIKFALGRFDNICIELISKLEKESNVQLNCLDEAQAIHESIDYVLKDGFFNDVGNLEMIPQNNQVLQKREGYSQIFAAFSMIDLALQLDWKGKDDIYEGESKNVALLYEYWLFFELFRIISSIDGCTPIKTDKDPFLKTDHGITLALKEGERSSQYFEIEKSNIKLNLYYNRTFSPGEFRLTRYEGSYSRPFRPDFTIAIFPAYCKGKMNGEDEAIDRGSVKYIHFDAKYRITDLTFFSNETSWEAEKKEIDDEKAESINNTYKRGDLLKMHTYNDAIRRTVGSYVLYPGSDIKNTKPFRLYDEILPGVGAFSMKPSIKIEGEETLKNFLLSVILNGMARDSRLNRVNYYT